MKQQKRPEPAQARGWSEVRDSRRPREEQVAAYREQFLDEVRSYSLREVREEAGLTQVQLAERMNVTQPSVSALERGEMDKAGLVTIKAYVEALGGTVQIVAQFGDQHFVIG
ncbi:MAG: helix-turn-helix domain-containing protein [Actinomycetes bacterium]